MILGDFLVRKFSKILNSLNMESNKKLEPIAILDLIMESDGIGKKLSWKGRSLVKGQA